MRYSIYKVTAFDLSCDNVITGCEKMRDDCFTIENGILTGYWGEEENVEVPRRVKEIGDMAFGHSGCTNIKSIVLPNGLKRIGDSAFELCQNMEKINIPQTVTEIGVAAFCECERLREITLPNKPHSIGERAFFRCISMQSITFPASTIEIGITPFLSCEGLQSIEVDNDNPMLATVDGVLYNKDRTDVILDPHARRDKT